MMQGIAQTWLGLVVLIGASAFPLRADLLPEALGEFVRGDLSADAPEQVDVFTEFGFEEGETARYTAPSGAFIDVTAWFFRDDTGAFAAFHWAQPEGADFIEYGERAGQADGSTWIHFSNYVVRIDGAIPDDENVEIMLTYLPRPRPAADPPVLSYLPDGDEYTARRYVLGPASLDALEPSIPPSVAAFHFDPEAVFATYATPAGRMRMLLFSYPTPQMARAQINAFQQLDGLVAKRTGSLIAVVAEPASSDEAQRLLARVEYDAEITVTNDAPTPEQNMAQAIVNIFIFAGVMCVLMLGGGLGVALLRAGVTQVAPDSLFAMSKDTELTQLGIGEQEPSSPKDRFGR